MESPIYIALSRQTALARELNVVANNVANASTTGFRAERTLFQEYLLQTGRGGQRDQVSETQDVGLVRDTRPGDLIETANTSDIAVRGTGYLVIGAPGQELYTRSSTFTINANNQIQTADGYPLLGQNGPITLPPGQTAFRVAGDGSVTSPDGSQQYGKLRTVQFDNEQLLRKAGVNAYATDQTAKPLAQPDIVQGAIEGSNVKPIMEITRLVQIQRDYEAIQKMVQDQDDQQKQALQRLVQNA